MRKLKGWNSKGPSVKWGKKQLKNGTSVKRTNVKYQMGRRNGETSKLQISNKERRNAETKQAKHARESAKACNGISPSMHRKQTKYAKETALACKGIRPSMQGKQTKHARESD
ncbi:hypothetical protein TNCV_218801 [Trichonephila clavipes]|uniref:Uncharacterized protein n=1 Tax=Trichonephila clavipes TaxID=2585209 RepID=A0A8X6VF10_TRICX|nr:hypothetical protein TNCV_218801 [Trichonephila clavipes]